MAKPKKDARADSSTAATVGYEAQLWQMADALRGSMDAAEYKHVCLGLLFLKYISDAFEERHAALLAEKSKGADPEDPDEYRAQSIFWVPPEARWSHLKAQARQPTIGQLVDDAMAGIERDNPALKGVLPKDYARPALDKTRLGQHIVHHLAPAGVAGFVLANGSMSSNQSGEGEIRRKLIEADMVDCMVALPGQLFYSTPIPACLWFLARDRKNGKFRDRRGHVLFIDARKLGPLVDRTHRELTAEDIARIAGTYHAWRGEPVSPPLPQGEGRGEGGGYADIPGFCKSAPLEEVRKHGHVLTPGRYVGTEAQEDDGEPFEEKMTRFTATLREQQAEAAKLDAAIAANLKELGYGGEQTIRRYQTRAVEAAQVIEELIALAKEMREASARGESLRLSEDELAFYDALETNDSAVKVLGDETLRTIAQELVRTVRANVTIDWTLRENVRAQLRVLVKRILRRYGYPPDKQEKATETVLEQAALLSAEWAAA